METILCFIYSSFWINAIIGVYSLEWRSGFVNSNDNSSTDNNYKNPNEETYKAGLDYIESTTGETALDYFTTRNDITNYNNERVIMDGTIPITSTWTQIGSSNIWRTKLSSDIWIWYSIASGSWFHSNKT